MQINAFQYFNYLNNITLFPLIYQHVYCFWNCDRVVDKQQFKGRTRSVNKQSKFCICFLLKVIIIIMVKKIFYILLIIKQEIIEKLFYHTYISTIFLNIINIIFAQIRFWNVMTYHSFQQIKVIRFMLCSSKESSDIGILYLTRRLYLGFFWGGEYIINTVKLT